MKSKNFPWELVVLSVIFVFLNVWTIKDGHNWGGDFSQYIRHAQNIVEHKSYSWSYDLEQKSISPPGFPLILAPFLKIFGLNFPGLKSLNVFFWLLFVWCFYPLMRRSCGKDLALLGAAILLTSPHFFIFKQNVLSDIPFLFFTTAGLLAWTEFAEHREEYSFRQHKWLLTAALFFTGYATLVRWAGFVLFFLAGIYFLFSRRERKVCWPILGALALTVLIQRIFESSYGYHVAEIQRPFTEWLMMSFDHTWSLLVAVLSIFFPIRTRLTEFLFANLTVVLVLGVALALPVVVGIFIQKFCKRSFSFLEHFSFFYLLALWFWYIPGGTGRYALPIIGPLLIFFSQVVRQGVEWLRNRWGQVFKISGEYAVKVLFAGLILHNVISVTLVFSFDDDLIYQPTVKEMTAWVKHNTSEQDRFLFREPRVFGLLTGRRGTSFDSYDFSGDLNQRLKQFSVNYIVFEKMNFHLEDERFNTEMLSRDFLGGKKHEFGVWGTDLFRQQIDPKQFAAEQVWENQGFRIMKITPVSRR